MSDKAVDPGAPGQDTRVDVWDFGSAKRLAEHQIRLIERSHGDFARKLSVVLAGLLREYVEVTISEIGESSWEAVLSEIPSPCVVYTFTASPLEGFGILNIDIGFAFAIVDRLLGGKGKPIDEARELTSIEQRLLARFVDQVVKSAGEAWKSYKNLDFIPGDYVSTPEFIPSLGLNDTAISVSLSMRLTELSGSLKIVYPYLMFEPVIKALAKTQPTRKRGGNRARMEAFLKDVPLTVSARLSPSLIGLKHLLSLEPGDVLLLDNHVNDEVEIAIGGTCLYLGRPGNLGGRIAVKITRPVEGGMGNVG